MNTALLTLVSMSLAWAADAPPMKTEVPFSNAANVQMQVDAATLQLATHPLNVLSDNHLVVMEYEAWFGPNAVPFEGLAAVPTLSSASMKAVGRIGYDSSDPAVIKQHVAWMRKIGVDAIILDESNAVSCAYAQDVAALCSGQGGQEQHDRLQNIIKNNVAIYDYYRDNNVPIKIIPLLDGQDEHGIVADAGGASTLEKQLRHWKAVMDSHPNQVVYYQGKPLIQIYGGTPFKLAMQTAVNKTLANTGLSGAFTVRFTTGYTDDQSNLYARVPGLAGVRQMSTNLWSFLDRFRVELGMLPTYSVSGGVVENLTVTSAFPGKPDWNAPSTGQRSAGVLNAFMDVAKKLRPTFLIINQFNEYVQPDQGKTLATSNDIEPTNIGGTASLDLFTAAIADYRKAVGGLILSSQSLRSAPGGGAPSTAGPSTYAGFFAVGGDVTAYRANGQGQYCGYASPAAYLAAGGNKKGGPPRLANVPPGLSFTGVCL